jgi:hypothetical protein
MNDRNREDLAGLIKKLYHGEQARKVLRDIKEGERILHDNPTPEPDRKLITDIKATIAMRLPARQVQISRWRTYKEAAVAASVIIIAAIGTTLINDSPQKAETTRQVAGMIPTAVWESNDIAVDDENLAIFSAEIDQIENEVITLESGDDKGDSTRTVEELEMELILVSGDFWKERF